MQHFAAERLIIGINAHARSEWALDYTIAYMTAMPVLLAFVLVTK